MYRAEFLKYIAQTSDFPPMLEISRAENCFIYDTAGKAYIDLMSGIGVSNLGHQNPAIIEAIKKQADAYLHVMVYGEYIESPQIEYAKALVLSTPKPLDCVYFVNSGTEATEGAMKLAKRFTGRPGFIACKNAYHGSTQGALSLSGSEKLKSAFRPLLPGITFIDFNDESSLDLIDKNTACVFVESIQGESGATVANKTFLQKLSKKCKAEGALLAIDEIQCGFGRTGQFWAFQDAEIVPDILLCGKAMGGGMPLAAFIASKEVMQVFKSEPMLGHITTFGGHPVSCAAGLAAFRQIYNPQFLQAVTTKSELFKKTMKAFNKKLKIHGKGLLLALELGSFEKVMAVSRKCREHGLLADWFLYNDKCLRIAPPLNIKDEILLEACKRIQTAIKECEV
jgi:acetylornithine/succinyldiaminopimelate/putrescine aminotransferase